MMQTSDKGAAADALAAMVGLSTFPFSLAGDALFGFAGMAKPTLAANVIVPTCGGVWHCSPGREQAGAPLATESDR